MPTDPLCLPDRMSSLDTLSINLMPKFISKSIRALDCNSGTQDHPFPRRWLGLECAFI